MEQSQKNQGLQEIDANALTTALAVFERLRQGAIMGDWEPYVSMMSENIESWSQASGEFNGKSVGLDRVAAFFRYIADDMQVRLNVSQPLRVTGSGRTVAIEYEIEGTVAGKPFRNRNVNSFDIENGKIIASREYTGDVTPYLELAAG